MRINGRRQHAYPSTSSSSGAGVPDGIVSLLLGLLSLTFLQVLTVGLESGHDVELLATTLTGLDGTSVDHETGSVETTESHQGSGHVLVTSGNDDHSVQPVSTGGGLDLVSDEVSRLQRVTHAKGSHRDAVRHSNGSELVPDEAGTGHRVLDALTETQNVLVAATDVRTCQPSRTRRYPAVGTGNAANSRVTLVPHAGYSNHGLLKIGIGLYSVSGEQHGLAGTLTLVLGDISGMTVQSFLGSELGRGVQATLDSFGIPRDDGTREHLEVWMMMLGDGVEWRSIDRSEDDDIWCVRGGHSQHFQPTRHNWLPTTFTRIRVSREPERRRSGWVGTELDKLSVRILF